MRRVCTCRRSRVRAWWNYWIFGYFSVVVCLDWSFWELELGDGGAFCTHCLDFVRRLMSSQHCGHVFGRRIIIIIIYYLPGETGRHMGTKRIWDTQLAGAKCGTRHARTGKHSTFLGGRLSKVFFYLFITFGSLVLFQPAPPCLCQCQCQCRMTAAKHSRLSPLPHPHVASCDHAT
jgi:hypothetical protein